MKSYERVVARNLLYVIAPSLLIAAGYPALFTATVFSKYIWLGISIHVKIFILCAFVISFMSGVGSSIRMLYEKRFHSDGGSSISEIEPPFFLVLSGLLFLCIFLLEMDAFGRFVASFLGPVLVT